MLQQEIASFEDKMHFLQRHTNVISLDEFFAGKLSPAKMNIVLTFDDGFQSCASHVIPILQKLILPATFFISSGFVNLTKEEESEFIRTKLAKNQQIDPGATAGLKKEDLQRIAELGFIVGGHTLNHCNLATLADEEMLRYEITEDKMRLENLTGKRVEYFAYPFGAYRNPSINIADVLRQAGYKGAVTTIPGLNQIGSNPFILHREATPASLHLEVFKARALGNYQAVSFLKRHFAQSGGR